MVLTEQERKEFEEAAKPLVKWINENCHPHVTVHVTSTRSELFEGVAAVNIEEFLKD